MPDDTPFYNKSPSQPISGSTQVTAPRSANTMDQASVQQLISAALQEQAQQFQVELNNLRSYRRPRASLPDPDKFDGTFDHWETWCPEMKAILDLDGDSLGGTNKAKFWYVYGRLDKKPKGLVSPQLTAATHDNAYDPETLFSQLLRLCNNPNAVREAQRKLLSLRQFNDQPFNTFLGIFERYLYRSGANAWPDAALIALLRKAVVAPLKKKLDLKKVEIQALESGSDYSTGSDGQRKLYAPPKDEDTNMVGALSGQNALAWQKLKNWHSGQFDSD